MNFNELSQIIDAYHNFSCRSIQSSGAKHEIQKQYAIPQKNTKQRNQVKTMLESCGRNRAPGSNQ
ncbi:MAG: hypothetical protein DWQ05_16025 [Calditrichaeota bacterium]|nr:MAG: hypothetical protein DWQ05_16025 [Calditrichota bacterium]